MFQQSNFDPRGKAKDVAKRHAQSHPDHEVRVIQETVTVYYVPEHLRPIEENQEPTESSTD
jgi:hypothetical protein